MSSKPIRIARHVYLRSQQRRLRHVRSIHIRNLVLPDPLFGDVLAFSAYFTLHSSHCPEKVLFKSMPVDESYNPSWESMQLTPQKFGKHSSLPSFILRVWVRVDPGEGEGEEEGNYHQALEKKVELFDLAYLGTFVNKDASGYPPNSVVVGIFEGFYSHPEVGGVPCPPRVTHSLNDFLPPQSLLEVQKSEVQDSYVKSTLDQILEKQEVLNRKVSSVSTGAARVDQLLEEKAAFFAKRREREELRTRLEAFRAQLAEEEQREEEERQRLKSLREELDARENSLRLNQTSLQQRRKLYEEDCVEHSKTKHQLVRTRRNRLLRQRMMVCEIAQVFFIKEVEGKDNFAVCNVILSSDLEVNNSADQLGVALGYVAHLVSHLASTLLIPLQYPVKPLGSRSLVCDFISDEALIDNIREFPLFAKGNEKAVFQYAVYLLNKDIAQIRQHCGYGTSKSKFKQTLSNLKFLLDKFSKEQYIPRVLIRNLPASTARASLPIEVSAIEREDPLFLASSTSTLSTTTPTTAGPSPSQGMPPLSLDPSHSPSSALQISLPNFDQPLKSALPVFFEFPPDGTPPEHDSLHQRMLSSTGRMFQPLEEEEEAGDGCTPPGRLRLSTGAAEADKSSSRESDSLRAIPGAPGVTQSWTDGGVAVDERARHLGEIHGADRSGLRDSNGGDSTADQFRPRVRALQSPGAKSGIREGHLARIARDLNHSQTSNGSNHRALHEEDSPALLAPLDSQVRLAPIDSQVRLAPLEESQTRLALQGDSYPRATEGHSDEREFDSGVLGRAPERLTSMRSPAGSDGNTESSSPDEKESGVSNGAATAFRIPADVNLPSLSRREQSLPDSPERRSDSPKRRSHDDETSLLYTVSSHYNESGYMRVAVATPHIISGAGHSEQARQPTGFAVAESDGQFLEDFIDSPS